MIKVFSFRLAGLLALLTGAASAGAASVGAASVGAASTSVTLQVRVTPVCQVWDWSQSVLLLRCTQGFHPAVPVNVAPASAAHWASWGWVLTESRDLSPDDRGGGTLNVYRRSDAPLSLVEFY